MMFVLEIFAREVRAMQSVGFIGLGNVGGKLASSLLRNKFQLMVRDLDKTVAQPFIDAVPAGQTVPK